MFAGIQEWRIPFSRFPVWIPLNRHGFCLGNRRQHTKNPKPFKTWDADTDGGVAGSRTPVRRTLIKDLYSLVPI